MNQPRVLVVDDYPDTLGLFEAFLSFAGFVVTAVPGGAQALAQAATLRIDAVATDLAMPGMDGYELIRRLRVAAGDRQVPIVAVTGQVIDEVHPADIGCCRILLKPCDLGQLAELLHFLIATCIHDCSRCPNRRPDAWAGDAPECPPRDC